MMYEYMTLNDNTTIAHSDMRKDGKVKVYIEKPVEGEPLEPVHVHLAEGTPAANATKIWITKSGKVLNEMSEYLSIVQMKKLQLH